MKKLLLLALLCGSAHAEFKDGNQLLSDMGGNHGKQMNAIGYVTGVADALMSITYCPPQNITAGQIYDMTKQYLENTPAVRHFSADTIISRLLKNAWPCNRGGQNL